MTAIVGLKTKTAVLVGGDSAASDGWRETLRKDRKVFRVGPFTIGSSGSPRYRQIIQYGNGTADNVATLTPKGNPLEFMVSEFIPLIRRMLHNGGVIKTESGVETTGETTFVVAFGRNLFEIDSDFQVFDPADDYVSIGCGSAYCLGSLASTHGMPPEKRIKEALLVAEKHSSHVRRPFVILSTGEQ